MSRALLLLAVLFAACASTEPGVAAPRGPVVEVRESFACPLPPSRGLVTVTRDGAAERVVFEGLEGEPDKMKTVRETMTLSRADAGELFRLVSESGWEKMASEPDEDFTLAPGAQPSCADCCSGALYVRTDGGAKSIRYRSDKKPAKLAALMKGVDDVLGRSRWTPAPVYVQPPPARVGP